MRPGPPLCPAGHLPLKGGDQMSRRLSPTVNVAEWAERLKLPISPLEGEMAGRPERGDWAPCSRGFLSGETA
ncbi:lytic murein transglycosylase [Mesorhizobium atlanticum]|uniref:Lytic murein transglycosylase n=1 Tax=Mesorhizobium atlanticum TaxID=2233532 RepID=A0A330GPV8_9HYPH|nr:lytic murein transglycosylase [Mesorhizobium atlanticum]